MRILKQFLINILLLAIVFLARGNTDSLLVVQLTTKAISLSPTEPKAAAKLAISAIEYSAKADYPYGKIQGLRALAAVNFYTNDYQQANALLDSALWLSNFHHLESARLEVLNNKGIMLWAADSVDACIKTFKMLLEHPLAAKRPRLALSVNNNLGLAYAKRNRFDLAFQHYWATRRLAIQLADTTEMIRAMVNQAKILTDLQLFEESKQLSVKIQQIGDHENWRQEFLAANFIQIQNLVGLGEIDVAESLLQSLLKAIQLEEREVLKAWITEAKMAIFIAKGEVDSINEKLVEDTANKRQTEISMAVLNYNQQDFLSARDYALAALSKYQKSGNILMQKTSLSLLYKLEKALGNNNEALDYLEKINDLNASNDIVRFVRAYVAESERSNFQQTEENLLSEQERLRATIQKEVTTQQQAIYLFVTLMLFSIIGLIIFYFVDQERMRTLNHLKAQNELIDSQRKSLQEMNNRNLELTKRLSRDLEIKSAQISDYLHINSHEVRSPLTKILGLCEILASAQDNAEREEMIQALKLSAKELDEVLYQLNSKLSSQNLEDLFNRD